MNRSVAVLHSETVHTPTGSFLFAVIRRANGERAMRISRTAVGASANETVTISLAEMEAVYRTYLRAAKTLRQPNAHAEHPRACARWTDAEICRLRHAYVQGASVAELSTLLGRSIDGVRTRLRLQGLDPWRNHTAASPADHLAAGPPRSACSPARRPQVESRPILEDPLSGF